MSKIIKTMLVSALFVLGLQANDLLSKATGGSINDNTFGVTPGGINYRANVARLGAYNYQTKTVHSVNYDLALQYNPIIKEIQQVADKMLVETLDKLATTVG